MLINPLKQLYNDFLNILNTIVIKYKSIADEYETVEMKKSSDAYINAYRKEDTFNTYYRYEKEIIADVLGIVDEKEIESYYYDRNKIPLEYREQMLLRQRAFVIENYVEKNNYYRCLNGLPDYEETPIDYIFIDEVFSNEHGINPELPIHELTDREISILENTGYLEKLIKDNPKKKYLKFLGSKKIDIVTARTAMNFSIIFMTSNIEDSLKGNFLFIYEQCREYFMSCVYITEYRKIIDYYDNFIAMCIMIMTLQQLIMRVIKNTIERDFFDVYCTKLLFDTYGVPYNKNMDEFTRALLVQNLNLLIMNKGSNKVVYDIASILGYDRLKIFKYYLMKTQKFDAKGVPIYITKIDPETGEEVPDYEKMYDIYFQKVAISDIDAYKSIINTNNKVAYEDIVSEDPFWVDDADLMKEMYESEFNYVESKYMSVSVSYRMSKILFENIYLLRMILDKKDEIPGIKLDLPRIRTGREVSLFDAIVTMCAMMCKQNRLKGEVLTKPSMILHVIGFNFEKDFDIIREEVLSNKKIDPKIAEFFKDDTMYTPERINELYTNFLQLYDVLVEEMFTTQDIEAYQAYKKLYNTIFYSNENKEIFNIGTKENPVYAKTYLEYLQYTNPDIYEFINDVSNDEMYTYITHISSKLLEFIPNLKYLGVFVDSSETMETMLVELINFFKSYTTDMLGLEVIYILDMKPETMIRLIDHIFIHANLYLDDEEKLSYVDHLTFTSTVDYKSKITFVDKVCSYIIASKIFDTINLFDKIKMVSNVTTEDKIEFYDVISHIFNDLGIKSDLIFKDLLKSIVNLSDSDRITFKDMMCKIFIEGSYKDKLFFYEKLKDIVEYIEIKDNFKYTDMLKLVLVSYKKDYLNFSDKIKSISVNDMKCENLLNYDILSSINKNIEVKNNLSFRDNCKIYWN